MSKISQQSIDAVLQPIGSAKGLPNAAYVDDQAFLHDRDAVLSASWAGIAFGSELPEPGYAKPLNFMGLPLLAVRNKSGEINVFHNVCSHRGMLLVAEEQPIKTVIRCRYHSWAYDLDGALRATPHIGGVDKHECAGFNRDGHGLKLVRSVLWMDVIFVNLSGDAPSFDEFIAPVVQRWEAFSGAGGLQDVYPSDTGSRLELTVASNWKLPVENYCEAYHVPWVHPGLSEYSPLDQHYNIVDGDDMSGQGTLNYTPTNTADAALPPFAAWPADKIKHAEYIALYPNVLLGIQADHAYAILLVPQAADRTLEKLQICYVGEKSTGPEYRECREAVLAAWKGVFVEDVFAVEAMQLGRQSPGFQGGVFTPIMDVPTHHFHAWIARKYQAAIG
jgi:choline monooxygenase